MNSNTRVECERCSRLIRKTLARGKSIVVVHLLVILVGHFVNDFPSGYLNFDFVNNNTLFGTIQKIDEK